MDCKQSHLLSVVVTCYNGQKFLPTFFNCLEQQVYKNTQIIFVNDGSTDNSFSIIKNYCQNHSNAIYVDSVNQGVASAKDKGLVLACGDFVTFCDVDDLIHPEHFSTLVELAVQNQADMAVLGCKHITPKQALNFKYKKLKINKNKIQTFNTEQAFDQYFSQSKLDYILVNKIFSLQVVKQSGARFLEGTMYGEESFFAYHFLKCAKKTVYINLPTYFYVQWKTSLMHTGFNERRLDLYKNINYILEDCTKTFSNHSHYINSMRSGYTCGLLWFMKKSKFNNAQLIKQSISYLQEDCKYLKKCKKTAFYKRAFIPVVVPLAKLLFKNQIKNIKER